jgi:uncharacterized membrane protein YphA (DoxX/SURF4 family)
MFKRLLSSEPFFETGLFIIRLFLALMLIRHGIEVFDPPKMADYAKWMTDLHFPSPKLMAYLGKGGEFVGGILVLFGFLFRPALIALMIIFLSITFKMGEGRILMEDQHPFLFVVIFLVYFFLGAGKWSVDHKLFNK